MEPGMERHLRTKRRASIARVPMPRDRVQWVAGTMGPKPHWRCNASDGLRTGPDWVALAASAHLIEAHSSSGWRLLNLKAADKDVDQVGAVRRPQAVPLQRLHDSRVWRSPCSPARMRIAGDGRPTPTDLGAREQSRGSSSRLSGSDRPLACERVQVPAPARRSRSCARSPI